MIIFCEKVILYLLFCIQNVVIRFKGKKRGYLRLKYASVFLGNKCIKNNFICPVLYLSCPILPCPIFILSYNCPVLYLSCSIFVLSYICPVLYLSCPIFVLSYICPVLYLSGPIFVLFYICPVLYLSGPIFDLSYI